MFNAWFKIKNDCLYDEDYLHDTLWSDCGNLWGRRLGGRWCLDYTFKLIFSLTDKYWQDNCGENLKTNEDLYNLFENLGIAYKKEYSEYIHYKGKLYNEKLEEL